MKQTFYSNGKLLLIGEYTVLDGSDAFALPTIYGQYIDIQERESNIIDWESYDADGSLWFNKTIKLTDIINNKATGNKITDTLIDILHAAHKLNPKTLNRSKGFKVETRLTFPRNWGLGSSSTLINNIAQWFGVNAFELLANSFGGSGYDIACAQHDTPIIYSISNGNPKTKPVVFNPPFIENLYFIYLNKKQNTKKAVLDYRKKADGLPKLVEKVNDIIAKAQATNTFDDFCSLLDQHSALMSKTLQLPTIKEEHFTDFNGTLKSLGAWGGDFILAASRSNPSEYFKAKGYEIIIPYNQMIL